MAIMKVYALRDVRTQAYLRPFFVQNEAVMERAIRDSMSDESSNLSRHPEDYAVYDLGSYDEEGGKIDAHDGPIHVFNVVDLKGE